MAEKRGLVLILVIATVVIFVGLVWAISSFLPLSFAASPSPTLTADAPRVAMNCTSPVVYWKAHPELYPLKVVIGGHVYQAGELKQIFSGQTEDLPTKLQAQLSAAYLNILAGADQSYIESTIFEAYGWIIQHPAGSQVDDSAMGDGTRLLNLLEAYNLGLTGVMPCDTGLLTTTEPRDATETATATITATPSLTETATPSETPSPTNYPTEPFYTVSAPSRTPSPTVRNTQQPASTYTNTPAPTATKAPSNTPVPPTAIPTTPPTEIPPTPTATFPPIP
jgi:hypothetical protein